MEIPVIAFLITTGMSKISVIKYRHCIQRHFREYLMMTLN